MIAIVLAVIGTKKIYLVNEKEEVMLFNDTVIAKQFLRANGFQSFTDEQLDKQFMFEERCSFFYKDCPITIKNESKTI
jgi:hypothetical protein